MITWVSKSIMHPPIVNLYHILWDALTNPLAVSEEKRIQHDLPGIRLGDINRMNFYGEFGH